MTTGLRAGRRLALTFVALLVTGVSPAASSAAVVVSSGTFAGLGHGYLSLRTNLRSPSHLSAWAIDAYLAANTPLPPLGHAFKAAEAKYDVNALYLLAHAMHETAFGTSYIAQRYHNLFGWNAADRDPTGLAMRFRTYAAGVDYVAGQVSELYLSPWGKFYGGASTLRGMRYYASDPDWGNKIAAIANGLVLPTLAGNGVQFETPIAGDLSTGQAARITVRTNGRLPDGVRATYRFVPVAIVEAGAPTGAVPAGDPPFQLAGGTSSGGTFKLTVDVPKRPGRYRLELVVRDSDGTELTEAGVPAIPDAAVRVFGSDAVTYDLAQTNTGLSVTVTNVGRRDIPAVGMPAPSSATSVLTLPTTLTAWEIAADGTSILLGRLSLDQAIQPGEAWTVEFSAPDPMTLPAILVVRLSVGGDPARLGGSPPGVFRLSASGPTVSTGAPAPTASPDPNATASPDPNAMASPDPNVQPSAQPTSSGSPDPTGAGSSANGALPAGLEIGTVTPVDAVTRVLLNPAWKPAPVSGKTSTSAKASTPTDAPALRLSYLAMVNPKQPGTVTLRITNLGSAPLHGPSTSAASPGPTPTPGQSIAGGVLSPESGVAAAGPSGAILAITAIPAWGPATEPITFQVPLPATVAAGKALDLPIALPSVATGQSTFLVAARVLTADGTPASLTLFWLRSALPTLRTSASITVSGQAASPSTEPLQRTTARARAATPPTGSSATSSPTTPAAGTAPERGATPTGAKVPPGPPVPSPSSRPRTPTANGDTLPIFAPGGLWEARNALVDSLAGAPAAPAPITVLPQLVITTR